PGPAAAWFNGALGVALANICALLGGLSISAATIWRFACPSNIGLDAGKSLERAIIRWTGRAEPGGLTVKATRVTHISMKLGICIVRLPQAGSARSTRSPCMPRNITKWLLPCRTMGTIDG